MHRRLVKAPQITFIASDLVVSKKILNVMRLFPSDSSDEFLPIGRERRIAATLSICQTDDSWSFHVAG